MILVDLIAIIVCTFHGLQEYNDYIALKNYFILNEVYYWYYYYFYKIREIGIKRIYIVMED